MKFRWKPAKPEELKAKGRPSFEEVIEAIAEGRVIDSESNQNYPGQTILIVDIPSKSPLLCAVPITQIGDEFFLHTVFPSKKYTQRYKGSKVKDHGKKKTNQKES